MKVAVVFEIKDGVNEERAKNLALGIAVAVNAVVRGEPDVKVNLDHHIEYGDLTIPLGDLLPTNAAQA
jgi:hypothetical protein